MLRPPADQLVLQAVEVCRKAEEARGRAADAVETRRGEVKDLEDRLNKTRRQLVSAENLLKQRDAELVAARAGVLAAAENVGRRSYSEVVGSGPANVAAKTEASASPQVP